MSDAPNVAEWISAWATVAGAGASIGALVAAGVAALYAKKMWDIEQARDERQEVRDQRAQASRVVALASTTPLWLGDPPVPGDPMSPELGHPPVDSPSVLVINRSDLPIYDVIIEHPLADPHETVKWAEGTPRLTGDRTRHRIEVVPLESESNVDVGLSAAHAVYDDAHAAYESDHDAVDEVFALASHVWTARGRPAITFSDAAGRRWRRDSAGQLTLIENAADHDA